MISPAYAQLMARYNMWQNQSHYGCADRLDDQQRREHRGAFFGSIHATLCHLVYGDQAWMYRFTKGDSFWTPGATSMAASTTFIADWNDLKSTRARLDAALVAWADGLSADDLAGDLSYHSYAAGRDLTKPLGSLVAHMFNHQTHHRGQVHCLLTQYGQRPDDTDIPFMPQQFLASLPPH